MVMEASGARRFWILAAGILGLAVSGSLLFAMDWPLSPPRLAATFGTFAKGRVVAGIALSAEDSPLRSADDGELSFVMEEGNRTGLLPSTLGSFMVLEHPGGMAGLYSHLAPGSLTARQKMFKRGELLGRGGASGWIEGPGTVFQVFDRRASAWVNPLLLLPPLADDKAPVIRSLALSLSRADKVYVLGEAPSVPQGTYKVSVDVADPADSTWTVAPLAPYSIRLAIDGVEAAKDVFDVIRASDGELRLFSQSPVSASELRTREGRYTLSERLFTRGRTVIEVRVEDAAGNKRSASWTIVVE
jgi:hypothetical protein